MKSSLLLFSSIIFVTLTQDIYPTFSDYLKKFQKQYIQLSEFQFRQNIYNSRIAYFATITDYVPGVNNMTDWSDAQISQYKNLMNIDPYDRTARPSPKLNRLGAPESLDWRQLGCVTSIKSQGSCGSCWAFAATGYAESKLIVEKRFKNNTINLSEQYLTSCTKQSSCSGGYLEYAMHQALKIPSQGNFPYSPYSPQQSGICSADGVSIGNRSVNYYNLDDSQLIALLLQSPLAISISSNGWEYYGSGVFQCKVNPSVDHAVLLVGYTAQEWIIKNQWGTNWGQDGYIRISRKSANNCRIGASAHRIEGKYNSANDNSYEYAIQSSTVSISNNTLGLQQPGLIFYFIILVAYFMLFY